MCPTLRVKTEREKSCGNNADAASVELSTMSHLAGLLFCFFHREEGQEGDEGPVSPPQLSREKERAHSKSKKTRREHRHADRGLETTAVPSTAALPPQALEERQVKGHQRRANESETSKGNGPKRLSLSFPLPRRPRRWPAPPQRRAPMFLHLLPNSGGPSFGTAGRCMTTRRCPKDGLVSSNRESLADRPGSLTST